ncbi:MerC domain-containing protein [Qipengyuania thermophila]|uniref:MerC domain-containing protein n=1 Tax=Qipengyuania thermophila TaxID=2509361 RepID=UPI001F3D3E96|nr:MerC domain-containing protein [Qipengyuania thermophila]
MFGRLDRAGIVLSGLCAVHCLMTIVLVSVLGVGSQFLLAPAVHEYGLGAAALIAAVSVGWNAASYRRRAPLVTGLAGLGCMSAALLGPHGLSEAVLTLAGVALVALSHVLSLRAAR